jgi:6-phosphogluconolactonase (cycloisomerase 2 family)
MRRLFLVLTAAAAACLSSDGADAQQKLLYTLSNNAAGQNSVIAYHRRPNGELTPHAAGPFSTRGSGIDNDTNGKLGPNDNDTPLVMTADRRFLYAVNGHSNTIAAFRVGADGALVHVAGSPFPSEGIGPVSLAIAGDVLLVANRNEDPQQLDELRGGARANYASFRIDEDGGLSFVSRIELADGEKNTQVLVSSRDERIVFGNEFRVDVDFDGDGDVSKLFGPAPAVLGGLRALRLDAAGALTEVDVQKLPETVDPAPEVPTIPLGIWDHPTRRLVYVGLVTRNQLGVYRYDDAGNLAFVSAVPNSGQDICWIKTSSDGRRLYAVNNLPREDEMDGASTVTVFDISGSRAERPVEIGRVELPYPSGTFVNNRAIAQPGSTAFQFDVDEEAGYLYVVTQRIDQTPANESDEGNLMHTVRLDDSGALQVVASRRMTDDGVLPRSRPQGVLVVDIG